MKERRFDLLRPSASVVWLLVGLPTVWVLYGLLPLPDADEPAYRLVCRVAGYAAAVCMAIPGLHILRRFFRYRYWGYMRTWLRWHIAAAYLAFAFTLVHCRGQAHGWFTWSILALFWVVMVSGIVGFYGQKLVYRWMALTVTKEYGLERLEEERAGLWEFACARHKEVPEADAGLKRFLEMLAAFFERGFPGWGWMFSRAAIEPVSPNYYLQVFQMSNEKQRKMLEDMMQRVDQRRQMDLEHWWHRLGRVWLLFHGPAACGLYLLLTEHIWMSVRFGGY